MSDGRETFKVSGSMHEVRTTWKQLLESPQGLAFATDEAVGLLLGIPRVQRQALKKGSVTISFNPASDGRWMIALKGGTRGPDSVKSSYLAAFELVAKGVATRGLRIDEIINEQTGVVWELWRALPLAIQQELRHQSKSPGSIFQHDPDL